MNKLIVESINDKYFIEKIIEKLNISNVEISEPLCNIDEFICLDGINNLKHKLLDMKLEEVDKLGIVLDADKVGIKKRLEQINDILKELNIDIELNNINEFRKDNNLDLEISAHILNIDGYGELEDILKMIKTYDSTFADCLNSWRDCLIENNKNISNKDFVKFWIYNYIRFDTCNKKEQSRASEKCIFEKAMQKDIWNFDHEVLDSLKEFLALFKEVEE